MTTPDLAEHFGVSVRTIYRDIEAIQSAGIPVTSYQGHEGGFHIMDNYRINRQVLTFEDIVSILSTLRGINTSLDSRDLDDVIEKIGCLIPEDREEEFNRRCEQIALDIVPWGPGERLQELFRLLHRGITEQRTVSFTYTNYQGQASERIVEPMTLLFKSFNWYLFGYCRLRQDFRLFKLSRMRTPELLPEHFSRKEASYRDAVEQGTGATTQHTVTLELRFIPQVRVKVEEYFEPDQIRLLDDGFLQVKVPFPEDDWIYSWLLSFGDEVEVVAPQSIRKKITALVRKIGEKYVA
ncbi:MAG: YafY family transcriptional regulator [Chitinispirillaceae bacterium]|nr:YafY family transcriptional regulator [Chitinispirillaceae bacterium]